MLCQTFAYDGSYNVRVTEVKGVTYFCGKDVALALGWNSNPQRAIRDFTFEEDRLTLDSLGVTPAVTRLYNARNLVWLNESGVFGLIFASRKEQAIVFKRFIVQQVLPYYRNALEQAKLGLLCENDLHFRLVAGIRRFWPWAILAPGLGEFQSSPELRLEGYRKGYQAGQGDITILSAHKRFRGAVIELKHPQPGKGKLSDKQAISLLNYRRAGFATLVTCDFSEALVWLTEYFREVRILCDLCGKPFRTQETLDRHLGAFHRLCY